MKQSAYRIDIIQGSSQGYSKWFFIPVFSLYFAVVVTCPAHGQYEENESTTARLILNNGNCYDVEMLLPGQRVPACRLLLPEHIYAKGLEELSIVHSLEADWRESGDELQGSLLLSPGI